MRQMENLRSSVYEVVLERLNRIFSDFDNVYVSFSGGKDSGAVSYTHLTLPTIA